MPSRAVRSGVRNPSRRRARGLQTARNGDNHTAFRAPPTPGTARKDRRRERSRRGTRKAHARACVPGTGAFCRSRCSRCAKRCRPHEGRARLIIARVCDGAAACVAGRDEQTLRDAVGEVAFAALGRQIALERVHHDVHDAAAVWNLETVNVFSGLRKEMTGRLVSLVMPRFSLVSSLVSTQELLVSEPEAASVSTVATGSVLSGLVPVEANSHGSLAGRRAHGDGLG